MTWVPVDYWDVEDEKNNQLFRGSKTACKKYQGEHGGVVGHVIIENIETPAEKQEVNQ